ncbi:M23 family metallopeptidase [Embleya sp. NPDC056575]|uniref:M23 family metallopeptidase n=1 Tax=unclassified Embleya TaxID=2699296 RepID=UPI0036C35814
MPHSPATPPTEVPATPVDRRTRLRGARPGRAVVVVSGLALLAVAVTAGVQGTGADSTGKRAADAASADPETARRLADRGADVAARSEERSTLGAAGSAEAARQARETREAEQAAAEAEQAREVERATQAAQAEREAQAERDAAARADAERAASGWVLPTSDYTLTGRFGNSGARWAHTHTGLDFAASSGTPIRAAAAGTITSAGPAGAFGNRIVLTHPDGTRTWYCHQSRFAKTSGSVAAGEVIGYVGTTGNSTGPHLHFEVHPDGGAAVDPNTWLTGRGVKP